MTRQLTEAGYTRSEPKPALIRYASSHKRSCPRAVLTFPQLNITFCELKSYEIFLKTHAL